MTGGNDVDPTRYGEFIQKEVGQLEPERDEQDLAVARYVVENTQKPLLCICRGIQVLNVALGGTLIQDLPSQHRREEGLPAMSHRQTALGQYPSHRVEVAEGSLLEQIVGQREIWVNSFHHQAVGEVASCANLSAWAADGVVEAIELPDALFVLGVQWHPEIMTRLEEEASRRLFAAFAEAARG